MIYIIMGVSGSGKTFIGKKLAEELKLDFCEGDDLHPESNIKKMESGKPLNDQDRLPWLQNIAQTLPDLADKGGGVIACSALKKSYRQILASAAVEVQFIYLKGSKALIAKRMNQRKDHFMPGSLLDSQFNALEEPKNAITVSVNQNPKEIVSKILAEI